MPAENRPLPTSGQTAREADLTIIVPAYNEADTIDATVRSLRAQTRTPRRIIVVDDCSTDDTGAIAATLGVEVIRPAHNTGSKAGAQNLALAATDTAFVMAVDADTVLAVDAVALVCDALRGDTTLAAVCGYVVPQRVHTMWERARYVEYLYSFAFAKRVQDFYRRPLISSGCFSVYRTEALLDAGGWDTRTITEDMDLTWTFYEQGHGVRFVPDACAYPVEPKDLRLMRAQLRRWSHGFWQNVVLHRRGLTSSPLLMSTVAVVIWDAVVASLAFLIVVPLLAALVSPAFLLAYVIDLPVLAVPVLVDARARHEVGAALVSIPAFAILRVLNIFMMVKAFVLEVLLRRSFMVYEKGH